MNNSVTYSLLFWARKKKNNDEELYLYARVTVDGKRAEISLHRSIKESVWDFDNHKAKGNSNEARSINHHLDQIRTQLYDCYQELKKEEKLVTASAIKARYLGTDQNAHSLLELFEYHNKELKDTIRWGTLKNYFTTEKYVKRFLREKQKTSDIYLTQLNYKFISDFEIYLRNWKPTDHQRPMGNNTVMKHIQRLRKVINLGLKMEWLEKDPFVRFKAKYIRKDREFLSEDELAKLENKSFQIERLQLVKDLFIFSCYTGLSYSDAMALTQDHIVKGIDKNHWIHTGRIKTGVSVKIPILGPAWEIIQKYQDHPKLSGTKKVLPGMSNQKLNSYLKEIADLCAIKKNLSFHIARHTFATTVTLSNGVPIETVSKLLGHTKLTTTQIYARVIEKKVSEDMDILRKKFKTKNKDTGT